MNEDTFTIEDCNGSCPATATGTLTSGEGFYFRYRHGLWTLYGGWGQFLKRSDSVIAQGEVGDRFDGHMDRDEVAAIIREWDR